MEKSKRKTYTIVAIVFCLTCILFSIYYKINLDNEKKNEYNAPILKNKTIVRLWLPKDKFSSTREYQVEKFNKNNLKIYIMLSLYDNRDYSNMLKTSLAAEKGPDIMQYSFFELIKDNYIMNLKDLDVDKSIQYDNRVYHNDKLVGVRTFEDNVKLIWNKEIFKKSGLDPNTPPKTWEELIEYSKKIKKACPNVVPFEFPLKEHQDFKVSIGEPSVNLDTIYTSFWNYNTLKYDFSSIKNVLKVYNEMYKEKLLDEKIENNTKKSMRIDFYQNKAAMCLATFEDKGYFSNIMPLNFELGISELPNFKEDKGNKKFYISNPNFLSVNSNIKDENKDKYEAVKLVLKWLTSEENNTEILKTRMGIAPSIKNTNISEDVYPKFNEVSNFKVETKDPTMFVAIDAKETIDLCIDAIKGKKSIDNVIKLLNSNYENYCDISQKSKRIDFKLFLQEKNKE